MERKEVKELIIDSCHERDCYKHEEITQYKAHYKRYFST